MFKIYFIKILKILLRIIFRFDYWHTSPRQNRQYILYTNKIIKLKRKKVHIADIGCGLGEVTHGLKNSYIDYYDIDKQVLRFLKITKYFNNKSKFYIFDFSKDFLKKKYDVVVLLNFLHNINNYLFLEKLSKIYLENINKSGFLIFDIIDGNKNYKFNHNLKLFLEKNKVNRVLISNKMKFNRRIIVVMKN